MIVQLLISVRIELTFCHLSGVTQRSTMPGYPTCFGRIGAYPRLVLWAVRAEKETDASSVSSYICVFRNAHVQ